MSSPDERGVMGRRPSSTEKLETVGQRVWADQLREPADNEPLRDYFRTLVKHSGHHSEGGYYLPAAEFVLKKTMTEDRVMKQLIQSYPEAPLKDLEKYRDMICQVGVYNDSNKTYRLIFALLISIDEVKLLSRFLAPVVGINDADIPLSLVTNGIDSYGLRRGGPSNPPVPCSRHIDVEILKKFCVSQWSLVAPIFTRIADEQQLSMFYETHNAIFPWTGITKTVSARFNIIGAEPGKLYVGKCSMSLIQIHKHHHIFDVLVPLEYGSDEPTVDKFAVMRFNLESDETDFRPEDGGLMKFTKRFLGVEMGVDYKTMRMLESWKQHDWYHILVGYSEK